MSYHENKMGETKKVGELREDLDNVNVKVRVIETREERTVQTRRGEWTISEAMVGDETGRVKLTLWGRHAGTLKEGEAIEVKGAWTTSYRGDVQLNVGQRGEIERIPDEEVPSTEEIPEDIPKSSGSGYGYRRSSGYRRSGSNRYRGRRY
ncbi:MAG: OB-fold nucleic acid binding domain-containing protein [Desulfurococcales archaeon]|nr:OB-fold nucleic acid binding domain-containing protein [Desulfurococcales archaeon]